MAGRTDLPVKGTLSAERQAFGNAAGSARQRHFQRRQRRRRSDEPFNRLQATVNYDSQTIDVPQFRLDDGPAYVEMTANFTHPANDLEEGQVQLPRAQQ